MGSRTATALLVIATAFSIGVLIPKLGDVRLPGIQRGYEPEQPIAFSHRLHGGELAVPCLYCHFGAETSRHAGIPPANVCMNCHRFVTAPVGAIRAEDEAAAEEKRAPRRVVSSELRKLYDALGLDGELKPATGAHARPIAWVKVHNLPDFVYFDHRPHVAAGVVCQTCHGPVETMERQRQVADLTMGWCVNCHRQVNREGVNGRPVNAAIDCSTCHF
ncbi:MAG: cytochrome c3 family protein [Thermoanaerobaculaceae bacterium]|nr:cytochrome c3 family protein [Thermoanaerobaculaceae bacterium]MDI9620957.1 cytochrome c3 family protein [Acidobacteriota bacterium]HPW56418.1 cytochrome c3 family protein [Thermoanaerobaculaceae bacterium]